MNVKPIAIDWHPGLPIFASESFLKAVSDNYGWLGGFDKQGTLRTILPFTVIKKFNIRLVRFRVETIFPEQECSVEEERLFLNAVVTHFKSQGADVIIPATTNAIFRAYPDGAETVPYGTYIIELNKPEEDLWRNVDRVQRQNINSARKNGVSVSQGKDRLENGHQLIVDTFKRSNLPFMDFKSFQRYVEGLGDNALILQADHNGITQSYVVFAYSNYCAYAVYAGNHARQTHGANKLLYWEAISQFNKMDVKQYDFVGARINPEKGSKQEALNLFKRRFGAELKQGYMWKCALNPFKSWVYNSAAYLRSGGDIVDHERKRNA